MYENESDEFFFNKLKDAAQSVGSSFVGKFCPNGCTTLTNVVSGVGNFFKEVACGGNDCFDMADEYVRDLVTDGVKRGALCALTSQGSPKECFEKQLTAAASEIRDDVEAKVAVVTDAACEKAKTAGGVVGEAACKKAVEKASAAVQGIESRFGKVATALKNPPPALLETSNTLTIENLMSMYENESDAWFFAKIRDTGASLWNSVKSKFCSDNCETLDNVVSGVGNFIKDTACGGEDCFDQADAFVKRALADGVKKGALCSLTSGDVKTCFNDQLTSAAATVKDHIEAGVASVAEAACEKASTVGGEVGGAACKKALEKASGVIASIEDTFAKVDTALHE